MPVYQYQGKHYELSDGLSDEQALEKIKKFAGGGQEKETAGFGTAIKSSFAGAMNTMDKAFSAMDAYIAPGGFGLEDAGFSELDKRTKARELAANPQQQELGMGGKVVGALATLPVQIPAALASPFETGQRMIDSGESMGRAQAAGAIDTVGNMVGFGAPGAMGGKVLTKVGTGALINAGQDYATKAAIQGVAQTQAGQKAFEPTLEDAAVAGIVGGAVGPMAGRRPTPVAGAKLPTEADAAALKAADSPTTAKPTGIDQNDPLWQKVVASGDEALMARLQEIDSKINLEEDISKLRDDLTQRGTQSLLDRRQAEMEFEVKRQATLDFNAAERARQENATNPDAWRGSEGMERTAEGLLKDPQGAKQLTAEGPTIRPEDQLQNLFKDEVQNNAVSEHPAVKRMDEKITKQEELIVKLGGMAEEGRVTGSQLKRAERDLATLKDTLERVEKNVAEALAKGDKPVPFNYKKQGGAINPEVFKEGFEKLKNLGNGTWLRAYEKNGSLQIDAIKDSRVLGAVTFDKKGDNLEAFSVGSKEKGTATELYRFAAELGNDIQKSDVQTEGGKALWEGLERKGLGQDGMIKSPGNKQRGAILIDPKKQNQAKVLNNIPGIRKSLGEFAPRMWESAKELASYIKEQNIKDVDQNALQKFINFGTKGGMYMALKLKHPMLEMAYKMVSNADRLSRADIRDYVHDKLGNSVRNLSKDEKTSVWAWMNLADLTQKELTRPFMESKGFSEKQMQFVETHREVMNHVFKEINKARAAAGKDPISPRVAYAAMRSTGDYRRLVYKLDDKGEKHVVGVIGSNFKARTNSLAEKFQKEGYIVGEDRYFGGVPRERGSAQQAFMQAVEYLADKDPMAKEFLDKLDEITEAEHYNFLNMKTHTMQKKGVFGMEGRKQWETAEQNALDGLQQQLNYAEAGIKWGHMSDAAAKINDVALKNQELDHPNAKKLTERYLQNALGYNPSKGGRLAEQAVAEWVGSTGMGYSNVRSGLATARQVTNGILLSLNEAFLATQMVQPFQAMPGMKAYLVTKGLDTNFDGSTGYAYIAKGGVTALKQQLNKFGVKLNDFEKEMTKYAHDYHVYGSDLVEHSNRVSKDAGYYANKISSFGISAIENATRRDVFYGFSHMLHENGMKPGKELFEAAHNLTDSVLANYSATERAHMYNAMGPVGDVAVNLQTFKHNELSRYALFARQVTEEKSLRPVAAQLAATIAFAGLQGVVAFAEADWLYKYITKKLGKPDSLTALTIRMSEEAGKKVNEWTGAKEGKTGDARYTLSHGGFSLLGLDMSKRLGMGNLLPDTPVEAFAPGMSKLGAIWETGVALTTNPTEMNAKRFAREAAVGGLGGPMDRSWFSKDVRQPDGSVAELGANRKTLEGQVFRDDRDKVAKSFGFTGINESVQKQKLWETKAVKDAYKQMREKPLHNLRDEFYAKGRIDKDSPYIAQYIKYEGDPDTLRADIERFAMKQNMQAADLDLMRSAASNAIASQMHAKRLLETYKK